MWYAFVICARKQSRNMKNVLILIFSFICYTCWADDICYFNNVCLLNVTENDYTYSGDCKPCVCNGNCVQDDACEIGDTLEPGQEECVHQIDFYEVSDKSTIFHNLHAELRRLYYVVHKCPNGTNTSLKALCESNENWNTTGYVSSVSTYRIYKNERCAECNGEYNYTKWKSAVSVNSNQFFLLDLFNNDPSPSDILNHVADNLVFSLRPENYPDNLNGCLEDVIDSCNVTGRWDYMDDNLIQLCSSSKFKLVKYYGGRLLGRVYRNVYCALCNNPQQELFATSGCNLGAVDTGRGGPSLFRLFAWTDDNDDDANGDDNGKDASHCLNNQIVDPFGKYSCLNIICPIGQTAVNGVCQKGKLPIAGIAVYFYVTVTLLNEDSNISDWSMVGHAFTWSNSQFKSTLCNFCSTFPSMDEEKLPLHVYKFFISHTIHIDCDTDAVIDFIRNFENLTAEDISFTTSDGHNFTAKLSVSFEPGKNTQVVPPRFCLNDKRLWHGYYCQLVVLTPNLLRELHRYGMNELITLYSQPQLDEVSTTSHETRVICVADYLRIVDQVIPFRNGGLLNLFRNKTEFILTAMILKMVNYYGMLCL